MTDDLGFGSYLRSVRRDRGLTQPEAARQIAIEQSYLSKLETGKACPSEEVYGRLLDVYDLTSPQILKALSPDAAQRLDHIDSIRAAQASKDRYRVRRSRTWLVAGLLGLTLGGGLLGLSRVETTETVHLYTYQSLGVLEPGEHIDRFADIADEPDPDAQRRVLERLDERTQTLTDMRGPRFMEDVEGGRRVWRLVGGQAVDRPPRFRWAAVPGWMLVLGGLGCFFVSWRWPSLKTARQRKDIS